MTRCPHILRQPCSWVETYKSHHGNETRDHTTCHPSNSARNRASPTSPRRASIHSDQRNPIQAIGYSDNKTNQNTTQNTTHSQPLMPHNTETTRSYLQNSHKQVTPKSPMPKEQIQTQPREATHHSYSPSPQAEWTYTSQVATQPMQTNATYRKS